MVGFVWVLLVLRLFGMHIGPGPLLPSFTLSLGDLAGDVVAPSTFTSPLGSTLPPDVCAYTSRRHLTSGTVGVRTPGSLATLAPILHSFAPASLSLQENSMSSAPLFEAEIQEMF